MKGDFFDFVVYRIPEGAQAEGLSQEDQSISNKKILLFVSDPNASEIRNKLMQIMGSVGVDVVDFDILHLQEVSPEWKSILKAHNEKAIIFSKEDDRSEETSLYKVYPVEHGEVAFADDIIRLINDEKEGITERRKALWLFLKSWMS